MRAEAKAREAQRAEARAEASAEEEQMVVDFLVEDVLGAATPSESDDRGVEDFSADISANSLHDRSMTVGELFDHADAAVGRRFRQQPLVEASVRIALARSYFNIADTGRAEPHAARAVALRRRALGAEHPDTLQAEMVLALILDRAGKHASCEPLLRHMLTAFGRHHGPAHVETIGCQSYLAYILYRRGLSDEALAHATQAEARAVRYLGPLHPRTLFAWDILGKIVYWRGDHERGIELLRRSIAGREQVLGPLYHELLWCMYELGRMLRDQGRLDEARRLYLDLVARNERAYGLSHPDSAGALYELLEVLREQGDHATIHDLCQGWLRTLLAVPREADQHLRYRRSVTMAKLVLAVLEIPEPLPVDADLLARSAQEAVALDSRWDDVWCALAAVYCRTGQLDLAEDAVQASMDRPGREGGDGSDWLILALLHARRGEWDRARDWYDRGVEWYEEHSDDWQRYFEPIRAEAAALLGIDPASDTVNGTLPGAPGPSG